MKTKLFNEQVSKTLYWEEEISVELTKVGLSIINNGYADKVKGVTYIPTFESDEQLQSLKRDDTELILCTNNYELICQDLYFLQLHKVYIDLCEFCKEHNIIVDNYVEVNNTYYDSVEELYYIDAYESFLDEDSGSVVATINLKGEINWKVADAKYSPLVMKAINEILNKIK